MRRNHVHTEDADTKKMVRLGSGKDREEITYTLRMQTQGKLVTLGSGKDREEITYMLRMRMQGKLVTHGRIEEKSRTN